MSLPEEERRSRSSKREVPSRLIENLRQLEYVIIRLLLLGLLLIAAYDLLSRQVHEFILR